MFKEETSLVKKITQLGNRTHNTFKFCGARSFDYMKSNKFFTFRILVCPVTICI